MSGIFRSSSSDSPRSLRSAGHRSWQKRQPAPQSKLRELRQRARSTCFVPVIQKIKNNRNFTLSPLFRENEAPTHSSWATHSPLANAPPDTAPPSGNARKQMGVIGGRSFVNMLSRPTAFLWFLPELYTLLVVILKDYS